MTGAVVGNTELVEYGIMQERSDIRAHLSVVGGRVYVYPTENGRKAILTGNYRSMPVYTGNIVTAVGWLVPPREILNCVWIDVPKLVMSALRFDRRGDSTSVKGNKAVQIVKWLLKRGLFPLWLTSEIIDEPQMQVTGTDIRVKLDAQTHIQVKCDWRAGYGPGCSGFLFIQEQECNPYKQH